MRVTRRRRGRKEEREQEREQEEEREEQEEEEEDCCRQLMELMGKRCQRCGCQGERGGGGHKIHGNYNQNQTLWVRQEPEAAKRGREENERNLRKIHEERMEGSRREEKRKIKENKGIP